METNLLEKEICLLYDIGKRPRIANQIKEGYLSQNYILKSDNNRFFLKQYANYTEQQIDEIHHVKKYFAEEGIPIILPIETVSGKTYFTLEDKVYALFPFIHAKTVDRRSLTKKSLQSLAHMLARMHLLSKDGYPEIINQYQKFWDSEDFHVTSDTILSKLEHIEQKNDFDRLAIKTLNLKIRLVKNNKVTPEDLSIQNNHLVHGDYHEKNVFFDDSQNVEYVFDLEKAAVGLRLFEVIRSMDLICLNGDFSEENIRKAQIYLKDYNDKYSISRDELHKGINFYYIKKAHSLWVEKEHYINDNMRVDCFLEKEYSMLRYYSKHWIELAIKLSEVL